MRYKFVLNKFNTQENRMLSNKYKLVINTIVPNKSTLEYNLMYEFDSNLKAIRKNYNIGQTVNVHIPSFLNDIE